MEWEARVRGLCSGFPEAVEKLSHGHPTWFAGKGRVFCSFHDGHHGDGRAVVWIPMPTGVQEALVAADPAAFFRPPYVGPSGWLGVALAELPWLEVEDLVIQAFRHVAAPKLVRRLDEAD
jgi:hypothetical protein